MPRTPGQTNDYKTALDEPYLEASDISNGRSVPNTLDRVELAICNAESFRIRRSERMRRRTVTVPASDYRKV
jgi:hypothetical protein